MNTSWATEERKQNSRSCDKPAIPLALNEEFIQYPQIYGFRFQTHKWSRDRACDWLLLHGYSRENMVEADGIITAYIVPLPRGVTTTATYTVACGAEVLLGIL